ncbi:MAG: BPSS1780 family membrane protein [Aquabacterium sp.]
MKLKLVSAAQGVTWVRQGILACRQQMLGFIGLVGLMFMLTIVLLPLPGDVGGLLLAGLMPVIWMGFMLATRRVLTGQRISPTVLFEALKGETAPRREFAVLGAIYIVVTLGVQQLAALLGPSPQEVEQAMQGTQDPAMLGNNPVLLQSMLWRLGLTVPITLFFWHVPALVMWGRVPLAKALFFSVVATWRNLGAFLMYGATWLGLMLTLALADTLLLMIVPVPALAQMVAVVGSMLLAAAFYASTYFPVVDCFEPQRPPTDEASPEPPAA